jgi:hypothetical protein
VYEAAQPLPSRVVAARPKASERVSILCIVKRERIEKQRSNIAVKKAGLLAQTGFSAKITTIYK